MKACALMILCFSMFFLLSSCSKKTASTTHQQINVLTFTLLKSEHQKTFSYPGTIAPEQEATLSFEVPGMLKSLTAEVGDQVKKAQY